MIDDNRNMIIAYGTEGPICIQGHLINRHGLIAGATGTGKTVSLQVMAETFSQAGIPCFMADMKGDLSGISQPGAINKFITNRCEEFGLSDPTFSGCPTRFFDVYGEQGHPMRATISDLGPVMLSRLLGLNEVQSGSLQIVFKIADDQGLLLIDMKDLRLMLDYVAKNSRDYTTNYGNISSQSIGAIQRSLLTLESEGADKFFGEPAFNIFDLIQTEGGKGVMNVLAADKLMLNPKLYSTFLLWLLSELYTELPEVGDLPLPKFVFFFDEAHMLFEETPKALIDKIEQVVRLVRSKGVGVYFITQNPTDIPDSILGQLGNRIQHALRAFSPKDQKAVRAAAQTFRTNPAFKTEDAIMELATGEALVSFLDEKGSPSVVQRAKIMFPSSHIGAISPDQRASIIQHSRLFGIYDRSFDRESAYEILSERNISEQRKKEEEKQIIESEKRNRVTYSGSNYAPSRSHSRQSPMEKALGSAASSIGRSVGNTLVRSILGSLFK